MHYYRMIRLSPVCTEGISLPASYCTEQGTTPTVQEYFGVYSEHFQFDHNLNDNCTAVRYVSIVCVL